MKYFACIWLIVIAVVFVESKSMELPSNFKICKRGAPKYEECIAVASTNAIISMANGLKEYEIPPLEPLEANGITIGDSGGAVSLKQTYKNIKVYGLTKGLKNSDWELDFDKLVLRCKSYCPKIDIISDYTLDGKVLVLPITGRGRSNITILDLITKNDIYCEKYEKDGETFLRVKKYDVAYEYSKGLFQFDDLFNGDAFLSEQINKLLNDNWDLLLKELQRPFAAKFGVIYKKIVNAIFSRVPMNKIFPTE